MQGPMYTNPLNAKLNPICHLLVLLGAHPILYISRIRVKPNILLFMIIYYHVTCYKNSSDKIFSNVSNFRLPELYGIA
jgi:hypothetical protein